MRTFYSGYVYQLSGLDPARRIALIHRSRAALAFANQRRQQHVSVFTYDLTHLLHAYFRLHREGLLDAPRQTSSTTTRHLMPWTRALLAMRAHTHTDQCQPCRALLAQARAERAAVADVLAENEQLRRRLAATEARAQRMTAERDALTCERDEARWKLRNAQIAERHQRSLTTGGPR